MHDSLTAQSSPIDCPPFAIEPLIHGLEVTITDKFVVGRKGDGRADLHGKTRQNIKPYRVTYLRTRCFFSNKLLMCNKAKQTVSIPVRSHVFCAGRPHAKTTPGPCSHKVTARITLAVNVSYAFSRMGVRVVCLNC